VNYGNSEVTYAVPSPIAQLAPWKVLNGTEANAIRLIYDSFLAPRPDANIPDLGEIRGISSDTCVISPVVQEYADGQPVAVEDWLDSLSRSLDKHHPNARITREGSSLVTEAISQDMLREFLTSSFAVPFRSPTPGFRVLDSHSSGNGQFGMHYADDGLLTLTANLRHARRPKMKSIKIVHVTNPSELRDRFSSRDLDVIVVGGDEDDIFRGEDVRLREGDLYRQRSNAISLISVRPGGALADDELRRALITAFPREEFHQRYIRNSGQAVTGFSPALRAQPQGPAANPGYPSARSRILTFIVPRSERTILRADWLAAVIGPQINATIKVIAPTWKEYWSALADPDAGDMLWTGISVDNDTPSEWVRYNLFGGSIPIPDRYSQMRARVWSAQGTDGDLLDAERTLVNDGWVIPIYQHYQTYLVRRGLMGLRIDPADWPIPGVHYAGDLEWA
jgi:hypothetical protein